MAFFKRTASPKKYTRYQSYKRLLAYDFNQQCAYCEVSEGYLRTPDVFGVDHFRPFALFPELDCVYTNLYYCCNACNSYKGKTWPTPDMNGLGEGFADPCVEDPYLVHFRTLESGEVEPLTPIGNFTLRNIRLNREICRRFRKRRSSVRSRIAEYSRILIGIEQDSMLRDAFKKALDDALAEWDEVYAQANP